MHWAFHKYKGSAKWSPRGGVITRTGVDKMGEKIHIFNQEIRISELISFKSMSQIRGN
jgi:hypothetical protein